MTCRVNWNRRSAAASSITTTSAITKSLNNLTPADVYNRRGTSILRMRRKIKQQTLNERRRLQRQNKVA